MDDRKVVVLGANGRFGRAVVEAFASAGWTVVAQVRREPASPFPDGVRVLCCALADLGAAAAGLGGTRVVVHAVNPPYTDWERTVLPYGRAAIALAEQLDATLMLPGNVYNFGSGMPEVLGPDTPHRADTAKGRLRCALEDEMAARGRQGLRSVVIRAGDFFGGGRGNWFDQLIVKSLPRGRLVYPGPFDVLHTWAYLPDLAAACVAVAGTDLPRGLSDLPFAGHALTGAQLLDGLEAAAVRLGLRSGGFRRSRLPWHWVRLAGLVLPLWRELAAMSYLWRVPHRLDGRALVARVGSLPATPLDRALEASLRALFDVPALSRPAAGPSTGRRSAGPVAGG